MCDLRFYMLLVFLLHGSLLAEHVDPLTSQVTQEQIDFQSALDLFEARNYQEANEKFVTLKEKIQPAESPSGNLSSLCAFYELECLRKLGDFRTLSVAFSRFDKSGLTRKSQLQQVEIYQLCELARLEDWKALDAKASSFSLNDLPTSLRAQIAYFHGLAFEGLIRIPEAIMAFQTAITVDAAASDDVARLATLRLLAIYQADPEVQAALKNADTPLRDESPQGTRDLREAGALAKLFLLSLGGNAPLPPAFQEFLAHAPAE